MGVAGKRAENCILQGAVLSGCCHWLVAVMGVAGKRAGKLEVVRKRATAILQGAVLCGC
jgi:hypothetical protein